MTNFKKYLDGFDKTETRETNTGYLIFNKKETYKKTSNPLTRKKEESNSTQWNTTETGNEVISALLPIVFKIGFMLLTGGVKALGNQKSNKYLK